MRNENHAISVRSNLTAGLNLPQHSTTFTAFPQGIFMQPNGPNDAGIDGTPRGFSIQSWGQWVRYDVSGQPSAMEGSRGQTAIQNLYWNRTVPQSELTGVIKGSKPFCLGVHWAILGMSTYWSHIAMATRYARRNLSISYLGKPPQYGNQNA